MCFDHPFCFEHFSRHLLARFFDRQVYKTLVPFPVENAEIAYRGDRSNIVNKRTHETSFSDKHNAAEAGSHRFLQHHCELLFQRVGVLLQLIQLERHHHDAAPRVLGAVANLAAFLVPQWNEPREGSGSLVEYIERCRCCDRPKHDVRLFDIFLGTKMKVAETVVHLDPLNKGEHRSVVDERIHQRTLAGDHNVAETRSESAADNLSDLRLDVRGVLRGIAALESHQIRFQRDPGNSAHHVRRSVARLTLFIIEEGLKSRENAAVRSRHCLDLLPAFQHPGNVRITAALNDPLPLLLEDFIRFPVIDVEHAERQAVACVVHECACIARLARKHDVADSNHDCLAEEHCLLAVLLHEHARLAVDRNNDVRPKAGYQHDDDKDKDLNFEAVLHKEGQNSKCKGQK